LNPRKYSVSSVGPRIEQFLRPCLEQAGFRMGYEMADGEATDDDFETPDIVVKFNGPDVEYLLANRAELLLALEHVTMEALRMPSEDHSRISFDANDYRLLRIEELRLSAAAAAEKVKRTGQPFRFNPMNSRERRVIHLALRNETELRSESSGSGGYRQVVVYPAGIASLPELPPPPFARRDGPFGGPRRDSGRDRDRGGHDRGGRPQRRGERRGPR
jgi:spoIIIJ-associated protein